MEVIVLTFMCLVCGDAGAPSFNAIQSAQATTFNRATSASHKIPVTLMGTVTSIELLGKRELSVIPVDVDSRFAVTIHVESASPRETPLKEGTDLAFGLHSPARLFRGEAADAIGREYRFQVVWEKVRGKSRFSDLTASPIQERPGSVACRPLAPEDTTSTPPEVRAVPYCSPAEAVNCEVALAYLYQLASRVHEAKEPYVIVVARLGRGEKSEGISWMRLNSVKGFFKGRLPDTTVVTAVGERVRGLGQLEFYVGGRLLYVLPYQRNANVDCSAVG